MRKRYTWLQSVVILGKANGLRQGLAGLDLPGLGVSERFGSKGMTGAFEFVLLPESLGRL